LRIQLIGTEAVKSFGRVTMQDIVAKKLNNQELDAYHLWFSRLNFYPTVLGLLLGIAKKNAVYLAVLECLGEVPDKHTHEVLSYINSRKSLPVPKQLRNHRWLRLKKSVFMACLIHEDMCLNDTSKNRNLILNRIMSLYPEMFSRYFHSASFNGQSLKYIDPINFGKQSKEYEGFLEFDDVQLSGCGLILAEEMITSMDYAVLESDFAAGLWNKIEFFDKGNSCNLINELSQRKSVGSIAEAIDLTGRTATNYWHFLLEILPRIIGKHSEDRMPRIPFLINSDTPVSCQDALRSFFPASQFIAIKSDAWISVRKLYAPFFLTKALDSGKCYPEDKFTWNRDAYPAALNQIKEWGIPYQNSDSPRNKIFVSRRSSYRNVEGSEILETYLVGLGFNLIDPSQLSFSEQMIEFGNASLIVGYGGAAWANLLFARPDARIVSIVSRASVTNDVHLQIAQLLGLEFSRVVCDLTEVKFEKFYSGIRFRDFVHSDFKIDENVLADLAREL
jgi:capsular polysaccharide biosynthesis protein